jgi:hypothetical protein
MLEKKCIKKSEDRQLALKTYETARNCGLVIKDKIQNPKENELLYYDDIIGREFKHSPYFIKDSLSKWIPAVKPSIREKMSGFMYDELEKFRLSGKNENMLKNAYIKFMCWIYYRFMGVLLSVENGKNTAIVSSDALSEYELAVLEIFSKLGVPILVLTLDDILTIEAEFEKGRREAERNVAIERLCGGKPEKEACTNSWLSGDVFSQIKLAQQARSADNAFYNNVFCRISGVDDKSTYEKSIFEFYSELLKQKRRIAVVSGRLEPPDNTEIAAIKRKNTYKDSDEMLRELLVNLDFASKEVQKTARKAYVCLFDEQAGRQDISSAKLQSKMVYILCWIKRYEKQLFSGFDFSQLPVFIKLGGCSTKTEAMFMRFLAMLPVDVLILKPDLQEEDLLQSGELLEVKFDTGMKLDKFPTQVEHTTAAYNAEQDLTEILYQGSGLYRERQYKKAESIVLRTMMEEIELLWNEEPRFRPGFSEDGEVVKIPTIFAKLSGVPSGNAYEYWRRFEKLTTEDTVTVKNMPYINPTQSNPIKPFVTQFYKNSRLDRAAIKSNKEYAYGILREETQEHILDKLQQIIQNKLIVGVGENGTEYTVISVVLNLPKEIVRLIQKFDFTKKNPKLLYINTSEHIIGLEDSILAVFLNLVGFDVVFMVPTGYQSIERYFAKSDLVEHQIGEYLYDLKVPENFGEKILYQEKKSWKNFFGLGGK